MCYFSDVASLFQKVYNGQDLGICIAESTTWYGKIWEGTLKTIGGLGIPAHYVLIVTIILILFLLSMIPKMF